MYRWIALMVLWMAGEIPADVPRLIHYQGKLRDAGGAAVTGTVSLRFRLYDSPTATTPVLFDETHGSVGVTNGLFNVLIGSPSGGVPDSAIDAADVWLGVTIGVGPELSPRTRIGSGPHAIKARSAERLVRPNSFDPAVTVDAGGNVGVGTTSPHATAKLEVSSASSGLLIPRMSEEDRDAIVNPALGLQIYNTTTKCINLWVGNSWRQICGECAFTASFTFDPESPAVGSSVAFTPTVAPPDAGTTYSWTFESGTPATSTDETPSVTWDSDGIFGVSLTVAQRGCVLSAVTDTITVHVPEPTAVTFDYTGNIVDFTVPAGVPQLTIEASGAQGGVYADGATVEGGGQGARIKGDFAVTPGQLLKVLVGQQVNAVNGNAISSGGGGSFVWDPDSTVYPLIAAGGGGGSYSTLIRGGPGSATETPTDSPDINGGHGASGVGGNGGAGGAVRNGTYSNTGGGGAGWLTNGGPGDGAKGAGGGFSPLNGGAGGSAGSDSGDPGGFGGGGGLSHTSIGYGGGSAGGGGGYNGGGGGNSYLTGSGGLPQNSWCPGGGGGSYNGGTNQVNLAGVQSGNGQVVITY